MNRVMNSHSQCFSRVVLPMLILLLFPCAFHVRAQQIEAPDLWDIGTGEKVPAADVLAAKEFGAIIAGPVTITSGHLQGIRRMEAAIRVQQEGLQQGDIILGVDGMRTYGWRDFQLASFRNPLSTTMTLLINRQGDLSWIRLHDLPPGRQLGIQFDTDMEQDRFLDRTETLGVAVSEDNIRAALALLPARAAAELQLWSDRRKASAQDESAWLKDFIALYSALQRRQYSDARAPVRQPPIPYFQRLEKFYLGLAALNQPREVPPDLNKSGEVPEFYVLALPTPYYNPPLGDLKFSDRRFQILLARDYANENRPDPEIAAAAQKYAASGADGLNRYLDQVKAAILDPDNQGGLPFHSDLVGQSVSIRLLLQGLTDRMKDPNAPDWALNAYAKIVLDFLNNGSGPSDEAGTLLERLGKQSPYLARTAAGGALHAFGFIRPSRLKPIKTAVNNNGDFLGPNAPQSYRWALKELAPAANSSGEVGSDPLPDPYALLTRAPYAELVVLKNQSPAAASPAGSPAADQTGIDGH